MNLGFQELMIILIIVLVLFGANRIPQIMSGFGEGIKNFKRSMREDEKDERRRDEEKRREKVVHGSTSED